MTPRSGSTPFPGAVVVRQATIADLDLIAPLYDAYRQFYGQAPDLALARQYLEDRVSRGESTVFLAFDQRPGNGATSERALGFTQLYPAFCSVAAKPYLVLYDLFVAPQARRRGVARRLLERAREYADQTGADYLELQTGYSNTQAQALYESLGWIRQDFYIYKLPR